MRQLITIPLKIVYYKMRPIMKSTFHSKNHLSSKFFRFIQFSYTSNTRQLPKVKGKNTLWKVEVKIGLVTSLCAWFLLYEKGTLLFPAPVQYQCCFPNVQEKEKRWAFCYHRYAPSSRSKTSKTKVTAHFMFQPSLFQRKTQAYFRGRHITQKFNSVSENLSMWVEKQKLGS